jgi:hypothetical protein
VRSLELRFKIQTEALVPDSDFQRFAVDVVFCTWLHRFSAKFLANLKSVFKQNPAHSYLLLHQRQQHQQHLLITIAAVAVVSSLTLFQRLLHMCVDLLSVPGAQGLQIVIDVVVDALMALRRRPHDLLSLLSSHLVLSLPGASTQYDIGCMRSRLLLHVDVTIRARFAAIVTTFLRV